MSETVTFHVPDISCSHCAAAISGDVQAVDGVESVEVDVKAKTVTVVAEPLDERAIVAAIDEAGYEVGA